MFLIIALSLGILADRLALLWQVDSEALTALDALTRTVY